jgi:Tol biopolymer transport system component
VRLRFPEPGSKLDLLAIPVGFLAAGLFVYLAIFGGLTSHFRGFAPSVRHWVACEDGTEGQPAWSPDGRWIAYARTGDCGTQIVLVTAAGKDPRRLTNGRADSNPVWSPNGKEILYDSESGFELVSRHGGPSRIVLRDDTDFGAAWSPNGNWIAYTHGIGSSPLAGTDGTSTIYLLRLTGVHDRIRLVGHSVNGGTPAWSPTGDWVATIGWHGIYLINPATHATKLTLNSNALPQVPLAWSRDGQRLAYTDANGVYILNRDGSKRHRVTACDCNGYSDSVSWSPHDRRLLFSQSNGKPSDGLYIVNIDGSDLHRILSY